MQRTLFRSFSVLTELAKRGIRLPSVSKPIGNYTSVLRSGNYLYLSGALPLKEDGSFYKGKVQQRVVNHLKIGVGMDEETGYDAARKAAMVLTANILSEVPDLSKIRIITGFVNCSPSFEKIPAIVNGASDFFVEVFGENGKHISPIHNRSCPSFLSALCLPVEIEAVAEILP
ncbi:hypothetical protein WA588_004948 [Blastocystis sp. NMH]